MSGRRDADAAGFSDALQPRRDIGAVTEDVVAVDNDVADIDPDPVPDLRADCARCQLRHCPLNCNGASHGIDGACELDQHAVAGRLDDPALVPGDCGINEFTSDDLQGG